MPRESPLSNLARRLAVRPVAGWRGVSLALGLTAAAALPRALLDPLAPGMVPFATFYVSTLTAALLGGVRAGVVATVAATLIAWFAFLEPAWSFALHGPAALNLGLFVATQAAVVGLTAALRAALGRAAEAERALQAKVAELETLMDLAPVGIWFARAPAVREVTRNRFAAALMRQPAGSTAALAPADPAAPRLAHVELRRAGHPVPPEDLPLQRALRGEESRDEEFEAVFADGSSIALLSNACPIRDGAGRLLGAVSASLDVTALKRTEAALREAVAAREMLQREADHRIKNSLQLVAGVLRLQRRGVQEKAAAALLDEAVARVAAVAEAHAALQRSPDLLHADAGAMLEELAHSIGRLNPDLEMVCERRGDATLEVDRAIPLGLVVSELLTNAVRHAYPPGTAGRVSLLVEGLEGSGLHVEVRDGGIGLEEGATRPGSLGRELVRSLSARIGAAVETRSAPGQGTVVTLQLGRGTAPACLAPEVTGAVGG